MYHLEIMIISMIFDQIIQHQSEKSEIKIPKLPDPSFKNPKLSSRPNRMLEVHRPFKQTTIFLTKGAKSRRPNRKAHLARRFVIEKPEVFEPEGVSFLNFSEEFPYVEKRKTEFLGGNEQPTHLRYI